MQVSIYISVSMFTSPSN